MDQQTFITIATIALCLLVSFASITLAAKSKSSSENIFYSFLTILIMFTIGVYLYPPYKNDFISETGWSFNLIPLLCAGVIYLGELKLQNPWKKMLLIIGCSSLSTYLLPDYAISYLPELPTWANTAITFSLFLVFGSLFKLMNKIDGLANIQAITITASISMLSIFGGAPTALGIVSLCFSILMSAMYLYNKSPAKVRLTNASASGIGFALAWIIILASTEGSAPCVVIFPMYFILEASIAVIKKLSQIKQYRKLDENTFYVQAYNSGLEAPRICNFILKTNTTLALLGIAQLYAPNYFSLPLLALVMASWNSSKLINWQRPEQNLKDINKEFVDNIKDEFNSIKNNIKNKSKD